jgi:beta-lactam-binding protein with PASTA domain
MPTADFSRHLFQPEKRYVGAFLQQGRVLTDEDLNAHRRLDAEDERLTFRDIICARGTPNRGFRIGGLTSTPVEGLARINFEAAPGSYYLGGLRFTILENQSETFLRQGDWLQIDVDPALLPSGPIPADLRDGGNPLERHDLVYLRAWEQNVTATEDSELLERALGGPDTSVYRRRMRRLELLTNVPGECESAFNKLIDSLTAPLRGDTTGVAHQFDAPNCELRSKARLTVGFSGPGPSSDLCKPSVTHGYLGAENQAIRVQLTATNRFIWGYDNASPLYRVQVARENGLNRVEFLTLPRDEFAQPQTGQAVEILPWGAILPNGEKVSELSGHLTTVEAGYDPDTRTIQISQAVPGDWVDWLDAPEHAGYLSGRDAAGDRKYFYLRLWTGGSGDANAPDFQFTPGTPVKLSGTGLDVTFNNFGLPGDYWVIAARPNTPDVVVPWNLLDKAAPVGPRWLFGGLALIRWRLVGQEVAGEIIDCRTRFRPLCDQRGCCTFLVGDGETSHGTFDSLQEAMDQLPDQGGRICLLPGVHVGNVKIAGRRNVRIEGCDEQTLLLPGLAERERPVFTIVDSTSVTIEHLTVANLGGIAFQLAQTRGKILSEITIAHNEIIAFLNAVQVRGGSSINIYGNRLRMLDRAGAGEAIVIFANDSVIERNDIGVKPAPPEEPSEPGQPPSDETDPEDPCADLEQIYTNRSLLIAKIKSHFAAFLPDFFARLFASPPFRALGGIRITAGAEKVKVASNRITGGAGNGITLGGPPPNTEEIPAPDEPVFVIRNAVDSIYARVTTAGAAVKGVSLRFTRTEGVATSVSAVTDSSGHLLERAAAGSYRVSMLSPGHRVASVSTQDLGDAGFLHNIVFEPDIPPLNLKLGFIYDTVIKDNEITGMGLSGIGNPLESGLSLPSTVNTNPAAVVRPAPSGNLVLGATISGNTISSCLLNPFDDDLRTLTQFRGLGGISLGLTSGLLIAENIIEANGRNQLDPVCGIFVGIGDQLEIHRNQIVDNGAINPNIKLEPRAGMRGGIVAGVSVRVFPVAGRLGFFRDYAARIHDNLVRHPVGHALLLGGIGQMSIEANRFHSLSNLREGAGRLFGTALVLNLGTGQQLLSGCTNFNNNQLVAGPDLQSLTTAGIFTADDLGFTSNQVEAQTSGIVVPFQGAILTFLINAFLLGRTLRAGDSRFKEPVARTEPDTGQFNFMVSLLSLATTLNNTVNNQGDHCIFAFSAAGNTRLRELLNQVLDIRLCARIQTALQRPVSAFLSAHLGIDAFQPGDSFGTSPAPAELPIDLETDVLQAQASAAFAEVTSAEINLASGLIQTDAEVRALVQHEVARLATEAGDQDPRVAAFQAHLDTRLNDTTSLSVNADLASLEVPGVEAEGMLIHGRVTDANERGIGAVLVCMIDRSGAPIAGVEPRTTETSGYYAFPFSPEEVKRLSQTLPGGAHISFFTSKGSPIFTTKTSLPFAAGKTETVNLHLDRTTFEVLEPFKPGPGPEPQLVVVPDLVGLTKGEAVGKLRDVGLSLGAVTSQPAPQAQIGRVLAQKPNAGSNVARGAAIDIVIGSDQTTVTVPDVIGSSLEQARSLIAQAKLALGKIHPPGATGVVISQEPKAESQVAPDTAVDLEVRPAEQPPPLISVPNVLQLSLAAARKVIIETGLTIGTVKPSEAADESIVIDQSPAAGRDVERGSAVDLVAQELSQSVIVPNVVDRQLSVARQALERARLKVGNISPADAPDAGFVTKQSPAAGAKVDQGTSVDLEVKAPNEDPRIGIIRHMAEQPDFEKVGASESKLLRIVEKEGIKSETDLLKIAEHEDSAVRDRFKLRNLQSVRAFKEILLRVMKRD